MPDLNVFAFNSYISNQLVIQASDGGSPPKSSPSNAELSVQVLRNLRAPQFTGTPYSATLKRNASLGVVLAQLKATDPDPGVRF